MFEQPDQFVSYIPSLLAVTYNFEIAQLIHFIEPLSSVSIGKSIKFQAAERSNLRSEICAHRIRKMTTSKAITLYRSILRAHSKFLPTEMRALGDAYVSSEFKLHKDVKNEDHLERFFTGWNEYLSHVEQTARARESRAAGLSENKNESVDRSSKLYSFGAELEKGIDLTDEQKAQLGKLREEASNVHTS
jgi:hypothetical protein